MTNNYTNDINSNFASAKREIEQIKTQISAIDLTNTVNSIIAEINDMTVDDELSTTSTKPVQNGVITTAINNMQSNITGVEGDISDLSGTVSSNYTILDTKIDTTKTNLQGNIDTLSGTVTSNYNDLNSAITSSASTINARIDSEVSTLETSINSEATTRENADNVLQSQIDAITAASDVVDIVGTYAALQAYNTSTLQNNDIVKVLSDESRDDETTYYRWVITDGVGAWSFIGEEGPYYTKSEADSQFVPQTRTINNKSLIENINLTASDVGALPADTQIGNGTILLTQGGVQKGTFTLNQTGNATIDFDAVSGDITIDSELSTSSENPVQNKVITTSLNNKQGTISDLATIRSGAAAGATALQSGDNISELNNDTGYITGISATDVTGALGYTPYNATNPNGYTSNVGTVTSINNVEPVNGNVTLSIPEAITIDSALSTSSENPVQNKVITSALGNKQNVLTAGTGIDITNNVISNTQTSAEWGNITGTLSEQVDLNNALDSKQDTLVSGTNIKTVNGESVLGSGDIEIPTGFNLFDIVPKDHVLTYEESKGYAQLGSYVYKEAVAGSRFGYPDFYQKCLEEKEAGTATVVTISGASVTTYVHSNGHIYYDIANKSVFDNLYSSVGAAWYYGIDTANERIFLPRNNWFFQNGEAENVGKFNDAGLPNIEGKFTAYHFDSLEEGAFTITDKTSAVLTLGNRASYSTINFDASKSNSIYGNSSTVQPKSVNLIPYMVVGNTVTDTSWVDVVTEVEEGVKDIVDATDDALERINSIDAITTTKITNCPIKMPQRVKYTLQDGVLTILKGTVVIVPYGVEDLSETYPVGSTFLNDNLKIVATQFKNSRFFVWAEMQEDRKNSGTWGNKDTGFITVTKTGSLRPCGTTRFSSGSTAPTATNWQYWYDTTANRVKLYSNGAQSGIDESFPLMVVTLPGDNTSTITSVDQVFNGMGYIGSFVWLDKDVTALIPNGRNSDGSLNNIEVTSTTFESYANNTARSNSPLVIMDGGWLGRYKNYVETEDYGSYDSNYLCYSHRQNKHYYNGEEVKVCVLGSFSASSTSPYAVYEMSIKNAFRAVDYAPGMLAGYAMPGSKYINLTLGASGASYTAPANGWFLIDKKATGTQYVYVQGNFSIEHQSPYNGAPITILFPVIKGQKVIIGYNAGGDTRSFRFIYAQGSESEV